MILPGIQLTSRINLILDKTGIDTPETCLDLDHWRNFPDTVHYVYNSRGFRDAEWPINDLAECIWCIGDSFTVGVGSKFNNSWTQVLQRITGRRCVNISLEGASNAWMVRQANMIIQEIAPRNLIIHWSYLHRDENPDSSLTDEDRRIRHIADFTTEKQLDHFASSVNQLIDSNYTNIVHSFIPHGIPDWFDKNLSHAWNQLRGADWPRDYPRTVSEFECLPDFIKQELREHSMYYEFFDAAIIHGRITKIIGTPFISPLDTLDRARDGLHYDVLTSTAFVEQIIELLV